MGSIQLIRFKLPSSTLGVKLPKREKSVNFFIWYMMRNFSQNRIEVESLFGIHIPPLLGVCRSTCNFRLSLWRVGKHLYSRADCGIKYPIIWPNCAESGRTIDSKSVLRQAPGRPWKSVFINAVGVSFRESIFHNHQRFQIFIRKLVIDAFRKT